MENGDVLALLILECFFKTLVRNSVGSLRCWWLSSMYIVFNVYVVSIFNASTCCDVLTCTGKWGLELLQLWCQKVGWSQKCAQGSCFSCVRWLIDLFLKHNVLFLMYIVMHLVCMSSLIWPVSLGPLAGWTLITHQLAENLLQDPMIERSVALFR